MYALEAHSARAIVNDRQRQYDPDRRLMRRSEKAGPRLHLLRRSPRR